MRSALSLCIALLVGLPAVLSLSSYPGDFVDPDVVIANNTDQQTSLARVTIVQWADELAAEGPWSVLDKAYSSPTGDKRDYMSWAPYWWPDCSGVGNTTELAEEQVWTTCPYTNRDGEFNPDGRQVNDTGEFQALSDAVLYNSMAWIITGDTKYSANVATWVNHWFLDTTTGMKPNLAFGQMKRGPTGQTGGQTGILDLKGMVKIISGVTILRQASSPAWTTELNAGFEQWCKEYVGWLETAEISLQERDARNNHGTFWYTQVLALKIFYGDNAGAKQTLDIYLNNQYVYQIAADGEQPLEALRTRPYHYRAYNLAAMITNARLAKKIGQDVFSRPTGNGTTIKTALDFAMTIAPGSEEKYAGELYPVMAAVAAEYGDADGKYAAFLKQADATYVSQPYYYWNQPLGDSDLVAAAISKGGSASQPSESGKGGVKGSDANGALVAKVSMGALVISAFFALVL